MNNRTDFVTNSSSSCFVKVTIRTKSGATYFYDAEDTCLSDNIPCIKSGRLYVYDDYEEKHVEITSVLQLAASILFVDVEAMPLKLATAIFSFMNGTLSARKLRNQAKKYEGFENLADIDPADYDDDDEFADEILEICSEALGFYMTGVDIYDTTCLGKLDNLVKEVTSLEDIANVTYEQNDYYCGEAMNGFAQQIITVHGSEFHLDCKRVLSPALLEKWKEILKALYENCDLDL